MENKKIREVVNLETTSAKINKPIISWQEWMQYLISQGYSSPQAERMAKDSYKKQHGHYPESEPLFAFKNETGSGWKQK